MNGADFGRFLATRLAEVRGFYDAVGLGAKP
jgi:hypothetical protein